MIESKCKRVGSDEDENSVIQQMQMFGWELAASQVQRDGSVKLIFQRDTSMAHYKRIRTLEMDYFLVPDPTWNKFPLFLWILMTFTAVGGVLLALFYNPDQILLNYIIDAAIVVVSVIIAIIAASCHFKVRARYKEEYGYAMRDREENRVKNSYPYANCSNGERRRKQRAMREARSLLVSATGDDYYRDYRLNGNGRRNKKRK
jgi:hypothetical protein